MFNLTRQERSILIFLASAVLSGVVLEAGLNKIPAMNYFYNSIAGNKISVSKFNINAVDTDELIKIKGIGPVLAKRIIDYRTLNGPFSNIEEIRYVKGIGPKKFLQIKDCVKID